MRRKLTATLRRVNVWAYEPTISMFGLTAVCVAGAIAKTLHIVPAFIFAFAAAIYDTRIHAIHQKYKQRSRPLSWEDWNDHCATAPAFGPVRYWIHKSAGQDAYELNFYVPGWATPVAEGALYPTRNAAKAAAQADYENKILEALR